jgi:hypothetical protein
MKVLDSNLKQNRRLKRASKAVTPRVPTLALGPLVAVALTAILGAAEPAGLSDEATTGAEKLKALQDPTILVRRVWLETEWNKYDDSSHNVEETLGGLWAWRVSARQDWAVRLKTPYKWHVAGEGAGDSDEQGFGDLQVATGTAFHLGQSWRMGGGLELRLPTAQDDLGDDVWRLQEFGALAWDATRWLTLSPSVEYNQSLAELHETPPQHHVKVYFPASFLLPHGWSVTPRYEIKVDFENDNYVTHSAKLALSKQFNDPPLGLSLSIKRPFDSGEKQFQVNFVVTYHFR